MSFRPIPDLFTFCSGADKNALERCSDNEQKKHRNIGAIVLLTAIFASLSGGYALYTVFDNIWTAAGFGVLWGIMIFSLDRYLVSSMKKLWRLVVNGRNFDEAELKPPKRKRNEDGSEIFSLDSDKASERRAYIESIADTSAPYLIIRSPRREALQALPRLVLALIIAVVISKPLEMKIFEKEINRILLEEKNALRLANQDQIGNLYSTDLGRLRREVERLQAQVADKETENNALYQSYIAEAEGSGGTMRRGKGPIYKEKRAKYDQSFAELQELRTTNSQLISDLETQIAGIDSVYKENVRSSEPVIQNFDGLQARVEAIGKMDNPWPSIFIMLLFLAIETAPILAKVLSPVGGYDKEILELEQRKDDTMQTIAHIRSLHGMVDQNAHLEAIAEETRILAYESIAYSSKNQRKKYNEYIKTFFPEAQGNSPTKKT